LPSAWRLADPARTRVRALDGEAAVFNPLTWQTHLLNDAGALVLDALREAPRTEDELVALLAEAAEDGEPETVVRDAVARLLAELAASGLAETAKP
jgi:PqqD family protein of HPr-rel-A system